MIEESEPRGQKRGLARIAGVKRMAHFRAPDGKPSARRNPHAEIKNSMPGKFRVWYFVSHLCSILES